MVRKSEVLAVPSIKWIGVYPSEIERLNLSELPLSGADNKKINDMLRRPGRCLPEDVQRELRVAQAGRAKMEIEGLYDVDDNYIIDEYLTGKIKAALDISDWESEWEFSIAVMAFINYTLTRERGNNKIGGK